MHDLILEHLKFILESIVMIERRMESIHSADEFVNTEAGMQILDSIAMRLQFIGESIRKIENEDSGFLNPYGDVEWNKIVNLRNFISHHYDMLNHEIIYRIATINIPNLKLAIEKILKGR